MPSGNLACGYGDDASGGILHGLLVTVVLDLVVDIPGLPVHRVEGPQAAVFKVEKQVVFLRNASGTLRPFRRNGALNIIKPKSDLTLYVSC